MHQQPSLRRAIGERLRQLRRQEGFSSQERLAHTAGVHRTYVGRLERGESGVTVDMLAAILAALDTSLAQFFAPFTETTRPGMPRRRGAPTPVT
jgi:transcriptional regulator with XRE-family HTH domain